MKKKRGGRTKKDKDTARPRGATRRPVKGVKIGDSAVKGETPLASNESA